MEMEEVSPVVGMGEEGGNGLVEVLQGQQGMSKTYSFTFPQIATNRTDSELQPCCPPEPKPWPPAL